MGRDVSTTIKKTSARQSGENETKANGVTLTITDPNAIAMIKAFQAKPGRVVIAKVPEQTYQDLERLATIAGVTIEDAAASELSGVPRISSFREVLTIAAMLSPDPAPAIIKRARQVAKKEGIPVSRADISREVREFVGVALA